MSLDAEQLQVQDKSQEFQDVITAARPNLSDAESQELEELFTEYGDIFVMKSDNYERTDQVCNRVDTGNARPIHRPLRRLLLPK